MTEENNNANNDPKLSSFFDLSNTLTTIIEDAHNDSAHKDFDKARANIFEAINVASDALQSLTDIANRSQSPKAYEVLAKFVEVVVKANQSILDLQLSIRKINNIDEPMNTNAAKTVNQNLFVGSTQQLAEIIEKINGNKDGEKN